MIPEDEKKFSGIYKITNKINGKVYIGKTVNFQRRYNAYKAGFKKKDICKINQYFMNAIEKYLPENFTFEVVEVCEIDLLAERELHWMVVYRSTEQDCGYNLRMDSSTGMITHPETSKKISERIKKEYEEGIRSREDVSKWATNLWKDEDKKDQMRQEVSNSRRSYFAQYCKEGNCLALWDGINQILRANPDYKWQNIYAACNGSKKNYRGFVWKRFDNIPEELKHLLVDTDSNLFGRNANKSMYETGQGPHRGGLYTYFVERDGKIEKILGKDLAKEFPNMYSEFCRRKTDSIIHKGVKITRVKNLPQNALHSEK